MTSRASSIALVFLVLGSIVGGLPDTVAAVSTIYMQDDYPAVQTEMDSAGASWNIQTVDTAGGDISLAFDQLGNPAIAYCDGGLKYAYFNGTSWDIETVAGGNDCSLAFDPQNQPAISYNSGGQVKYAHFNGLSWDISVVDTRDYWGQGTSLAFDPFGNPVIGYVGGYLYHSVSIMPPLKCAHFISTCWSITTAAAQWPFIKNPCLAFDSLGNPAMSYQVDDFGIRYAYFPHFTTLTQITPKDLGLNPDRDYLWRVRHQDDKGNWSKWSSETSFETEEFIPPSSSGDTSSQTTPQCEASTCYNDMTGLADMSQESNSPPDQPMNVFPPDGAHDISRSGGTFMSSAFSDPDGDEHFASEWQVTRVYLPPSSLTEMVVAGLAPGTAYFWHVRHQDDKQAWSEWSSETSFETEEFIPPSSSGDTSSQTTPQCEASTCYNDMTGLADMSQESNSPPDQPMNILPPGGAVSVPLIYTLQCSAFSDPDPADIHYDTHWQYRKASDDYGRGRYSVWDTTMDPWHNETVESGWDGGELTAEFGLYSSLAFDQLGKPAISYYDSTNYNLKYAHFNGSSWDLSIIDSEGAVGNYASLAYNQAGTPGISYHDGTNDSLKYASFNGISWDIDTVDDTGGEFTSLAFDTSGNPCIAYYAAGNLKYATTAAHDIPPTVSSVSPSVEETTATLNGDLTSLGDYSPVYAFFQYGLDTSYGTDTAEQEKTATGAFTQGITGLSKGTLYHFRAACRYGSNVYGGDNTFLTKPDEPMGFNANATSASEIDLAWTKGAGAQRTKIQRKEGSYPTDRDDGTQVYFDTGSSESDTGLSPDTTYYYRAWSEVSGSQQWSDAYAEAQATTGTENQAPVASFAYLPSEPESGEWVTFDAGSSDDPDGTIVSYEWDFGDGETAQGDVVCHRFRGAQDGPKTYNVTLTVEDDDGATDDETVPVTVDPLQRTVPVVTRPYVPVGKATATYNWVDTVGGEDIYNVSKIEIKTIAFVGVSEVVVFDQHEVKWSDRAFLHPGERYEEATKTYVAPFGGEFPGGITVDGSDALGLRLGGIDLITLAVASVKEPTNWLMTKVPFLGPILEEFNIDLETILEAVGVDPWKYPVTFAKSSSCQFDPDLAGEPSLPGEELETLLSLILSPGEVRVYDTEGRITGLVNGEVKEEIPNSAYYDGTIIIICSSHNSYRYEIEGTGDGSYGLELVSVGEARSRTFTATDIPVGPGTTHEYTIDWEEVSQDGEGVTVNADLDGDGEFEHTFTADNKLTQQEFLDAIGMPIESPTGTGTVTIGASGGTITSLTAVTEASLPTAGKPNVTFPHGLFSFDITNLAPGATVTVYITLPSAMAVGTQYWKCQGGSWINVTSLLGDDDGDNVLTLTLTDGGLGDSDGLANGTIVDPGGPGVVAAAPSPSPSPGGGGTVWKPPTYQIMNIDMLGKRASARVSYSGELLAPVTVADAENRFTLEFGEGTRILCTNKRSPERIELRQAHLPSPSSDMVIVGEMYELNAYAHEYSSTPTSVTVSPSAKMALAYTPDELPENTLSVSIACYDADEGWVELETAYTSVTEAGKATADVSHFTYFALLAEVAETTPAKFAISNVTINPAHAQPDQEITVAAKVTNTGGTTGNYDVTLKIDGQVEQTKTVTVGPHVAHPVTFSVYKSQPGTYDVDIGGQRGSFTVIGAGGRQSLGVSQGVVLAIATFVFVLLFGLLVILVRRWLQAG